MARSEVSKTDPPDKPRRAPPDEQTVWERPLTIAEFRAIERMSPATYRKLKRTRRGPEEVRFPGERFIFITAQARREWHAQMEQWRQQQAAQLDLFEWAAQSDRRSWP